MFGVLLYAEHNGTIDLSEDIVGSWQGIQYYLGTDKTVCASSDPVTLSFDGTRCILTAKGFPCIDSEYVCSGSKISYYVDGRKMTAFISLSEKGLLDLRVPDWDLDLSLERAV